jgi:hypothetical protein
MPLKQRRADPLADGERLLRFRYPLTLLDGDEANRAESFTVCLADPCGTVSVR